VGRKQGITEQQLLDLAVFETSSAFSELEKLVLRFTVAMTLTPVDVSDELFVELQKHFSPAQIVELTSAIAWENYRARFDHAFGAEAEGFSAGAVCALPAV
jgi:4-carboxymuconolactone decarboxylase